jgi:hypothetical protein
MHFAAGVMPELFFCSERTPVVNPGSLSEGSLVSSLNARVIFALPCVACLDAFTPGDFGVMTLKRQAQGQWMVAGVELISLDPAIAKQSL